MVTLQTNDSIEGIITVSPNARNPRDLDIVIDYKVDGQHPHQERREYRMCVPPFPLLSSCTYRERLTDPLAFHVSQGMIRRLAGECTSARRRRGKRAACICGSTDRSAA